MKALLYYSLKKVQNKIRCIILSAILLHIFTLPVFSQSAIRQLEIITGEKINTYSSNTNYSNYNQGYTDADYNREYGEFLTNLARKENEEGITHYLKGNYAKAVKCFNRASKYMPKDLTLRKNYENALYKLDQQKQKEKEKKEKERQIAEEKKAQENFFKSIQKDKEYYNSQLRRLERESYKIKVPLLPKPKIIHEGIILGLFNTNAKNAIADSNYNITSPFSNKKYKKDEVFATSDNTTLKELVRGVVDNSYVGKYTLNTEHGKKLVEKLYGTHFDRLIAHSNGATVSEALIREGVITVNELNIVGGDRSLINFVGLHELVATGKVKRIVVWINPGDIIPVGTSAGLLSPLPGAKNQYFKTAASYVKQVVTGESQGGTAQVEYRYLKGNQYKAGQNYKFGKDFFDAHGLDAYINNMKTFLNRK